MWRGKEEEGTLQRHSNENSKQIFPEKELRDIRPPISTFMCLWAINIIPIIGLPILLLENM